MSALAALFQRFEDGTDARMSIPASEDDLRRLDEELGRPLPAPLRALLREVGGGLFAGGHEIFGPSRVMIHDIELVPDLLTVRARLAKEGLLQPQHLPFHRSGTTFHLMRIEGPGAGSIVSLPSGSVWTDLASFVEQVLLRPTVGLERAGTVRLPRMERT